MAFFLLIAFWIFIFCIIVACCDVYNGHQNLTKSGVLGVFSTATLEEVTTDDCHRGLIESGQIPEKALDKPPFVSDWEYSRTGGSWMT